MRSSRRKVKVSKKSGSDNRLHILLDSTYLLPVFGIEVEGVTGSDLLELRSLALEGKIKIYYSPVSFIEVVSKIARESQRRRQGPKPHEIKAIIKIIEQSDYLEAIHPNPQAYSIAYEMKLLGHGDMIDNILYATASTRKLIFLTLDRKLKNFIKQQNLEITKILTHSELFKITL